MESKELAKLRTAIVAAMEDKGTNPRRLALDAGLGQTVVRDLLQRETTDIKLGTLMKIADALGLPITALLGERTQTTDTKSRLSAVNDGIAVPVRKVDLAYSMGPGTNVDDFPDETPVYMDLSFVQNITRASSDRLFIARGTGDSMAPTLINDDQIVIDTTQRTLNMQDRIWAISIYGAAMIKRLRAVASNRVRIISDNVTVPPDEVPAEDLHIVGRVVWIGRRV